MTGFKFLTVHWSIHLRRMRTVLLAFLVMIGLLCGAFLAINWHSVSFSWMRMAVNSRVSIVGVMIVQFLPFLLSAFAVYTSGCSLVYLICSLKAFTFGCAAMMVSQPFDGAGWLVRMLLLFSSCLSLPLLIWFSVRCIKGENESRLFQDLGLCAAFVFLIGSVDYRVISPFLVKIIE